MRRMVSVFLVAAFLLLSVSAVYGVSRGIKVVSHEGETLQLYDEYHALVVGVSNYEKWPKLPYAKSDAADVAEKLSQLGFKVEVVLDPTSRELNTAINEMVYTMGREENRALLFYYAGHGDTELLADGTKMGYLVPRDCPLRRSDPLGFATQAVSMRDIESASLRMKARHVLMLFDSCFSGSLFALVRAVPDDISEKSLLPVRQYITAGNEDEQVPDRSMFKRCFLLGLEGDADLTGDGYVTGSELGMYLSDKVVNYSHRRQHPQYGKINNPNLDRGDFVFVAPAKEDAPVRAVEQGATSEVQSENARLAEEIEQLRREKEELLQMKKLMQEKNRLKEELQKEKTKIWTANIAPDKSEKVSPPQPDNKIADRDENFIAFDNGIIKDTKSGLEWFVGSDEKSNMSDAAEFIDNLKIDGGGWRLPTSDELKTLYSKGRGKSNMSSLFKTTGYWVWSNDRAGHWGVNEVGFDFRKGEIEEIQIGSAWKGSRAFAVRSSQDGKHYSKSMK